MEEGEKIVREPNPGESPGLFSKLTFLYTLPIFMKGRKKDFNEDTIFENLSRDNSKVLGDNAEKLWIEELKKCKKNDKRPSVINTILKMFYFNLAKVAIGHVVNDLVLSLIYRKSLRLNQSAFTETTGGQMINLLSNDVAVFDRYIGIYQFAYILPTQLILFTILLFFELGFSSFIGISVLIIFIPFQSFLGKLSAKYRLKTATRTDSRIRLMDEIIRGIEIIKMYAWEYSFAKLVAHYREMEIRSLTKVSYIKGSFMLYFIYITLPLFITILCYVLIGNTIDAKKVFYATAMYNIVAFNMGTIFPQSVALINESKVSSDRIGKFLLLEEVINNKLTNEGPPIELTNLTAKWSKAIENTLNNVTIRIDKGSLVAIVGPVGSGKSSLLQSLLGEIPINSGNLLLNGTVSYSSQDPWIFNSSVRQNVLFGNQMDKTRYKEVINACALARDLNIFNAGDKTIVGEQGSALSGGQKARVNLARAVYRDADVYLLDDPLSAVDVTVGKHIFNDCICKFLKKKTVILVTHQLQYLQQVDRIIFLENGQIKADGSLEELQKSESNFLQLLKHEIDDAVEDDDNSSEILSKRDSSVDNAEKNPRKVEEQRSSGTVSMSVYVDYAMACGSKLLVAVIIIMFIVVQLLLSGSFYFMSYWVNHEQASDNGNVHNRSYYISIYSGLTVAILTITFFRNIISFKFCMRSSTRLHNSMFESIVHATMDFFNNNSPGRILNRFTKDMGVVDELLPLSMVITIQTIFSIIGILIVTCVVNVWMIIPSIIIIIVSNYIKNFYLSSSINIKRLEGTTKSPVFGHLHGTLQGLTTIRGFGVQEILKTEFDDKQDLHSTANFLFVSINRALSCWMDFISFIYLTIITLVLVFISGETYGGNVGLAITQAMQLLVQFQWGVRQLTDMENYMTSVERVLDYNLIEHERPLTNKKMKPDSSWPSSGTITFENVYLSYAPDAVVLKNLNFTICSEEKIGIVGRTGAGKSSIISAIFQLFDIQGKIIIDDVNIQEIGLHDLRKKISIIPQNPVIFAGSIRRNLDPFDECSDELLWKALEEVNMKDAVEALDSGLQMEISEGGLNLSVGQRQLICLARAIIRNNKILILDEATANVDPQTDAVIQETIRTKFSKCTVLTVAHRLHTIIDSDKILVLDAGEVVEFDRPDVLLENKDGVFYKMVQQVDKNMITDGKAIYGSGSGKT
ncbi:hypothetical protein FQR65_LT04607 [Abscondita terminalis]|nr:hypothetical protein FQR65_LT04607 [Abscondita terminalis]